MRSALRAEVGLGPFSHILAIVASSIVVDGEEASRITGFSYGEDNVSTANAMRAEAVDEAPGKSRQRPARLRRSLASSARSCFTSASSASRVAFSASASVG